MEVPASEFGMERWSGKVALVTGANSGIGAAITRRLLKLGLIVVALDRSVELLQEWAVKDGSVGRLYPRQCDLCHENEVLETFRWIETCLGGVDILVNNAGVTGQHSIIEGNPDEWRHLLDVNVVALCLCTREAVASMRRRDPKNGHIFNLSSTLAHTVPPFGPLHFYAATKHAVSALTEALRQELQEVSTRIRVTCISPGLVKSSIFKTCLGPDVHETVYERPSLDAADVASAIEYALSCPTHVQVETLRSPAHPSEKSYQMSEVVNEIVIKPMESVT